MRCRSGAAEYAGLSTLPTCVLIKIGNSRADPRLATLPRVATQERLDICRTHVAQMAPAAYEYESLGPSRIPPIRAQAVEFDAQFAPNFFQHTRSRLPGRAVITPPFPT